MIVEIKKNETDIELLKYFLSGAGNSVETFRYFSKRSFDVIENHIYTILFINDENFPIGYGHLDYEDSIVWLGICVSENSIGKGVGRQIMNNLLDKASTLNYKSVILKVDNTNFKAISLYKSFGFILVGEEVDSSLLTMRYTIDHAN